MMVHTDMHLHTYYSDGAESPETVVCRASRLGFDLIAITDHDGAGGLCEALKAGEKYGVKVVRGIELSSEYEKALPGFPEDRYFMHILGYGIDPDYEPLKEKLKYVLERRAFRNGEIQEVLRKKGIEVSDEELAVSSPNGFVGKLSFAKAFVRRGICPDVASAFRSKELLGAPDIKNIRKDKIGADEALSLIRGAGGIAFFAHPFQLGYTRKSVDSEENFRKKLRFIAEELKEKGLFGMECYYPVHSREQTEFLTRLADSLKLAVSRGSDDHGEGIRKDKHMGAFQADMPEERERALREIFCAK